MCVGSEKQPDNGSLHEKQGYIITLPENPEPVEAMSAR
jgi:hypothetical protein